MYITVRRSVVRTCGSRGVMLAVFCRDIFFMRTEIRDLLQNYAAECCQHAVECWEFSSRGSCMGYGNYFFF